MDTNSIIKKLKLDKNGFDKIQDAVKKAESKTSGEIAVCLAAESSDYAIWELFSAIICSVICFGIMLPFASQIRSFYESVNWLNPQWYLPATYGIVIFLCISIFFMLFNIPALDRIVIPKVYRNNVVTKKSFEIFTQTGVYCTENHNGILIYVSYLERQVRIVADKGINDRISNNLWQLIADSLVAELKKGNAISGFCDAIEKCGELLSEYFPAQENDKNELPDGLLIIED